MYNVYETHLSFLDTNFFSLSLLLHTEGRNMRYLLCKENNISSKIVIFL